MSPEVDLPNVMFYNPNRSHKVGTQCRVCEFWTSLTVFQVGAWFKVEILIENRASDGLHTFSTTFHIIYPQNWKAIRLTYATFKNPIGFYHDIVLRIAFFEDIISDRQLCQTTYAIVFFYFDGRISKTHPFKRSLIVFCAIVIVGNNMKIKWAETGDGLNIICISKSIVLHHIIKKLENNNDRINVHCN